MIRFDRNKERWNHPSGNGIKTLIVVLLFVFPSVLSFMSVLHRSPIFLDANVEDGAGNPPYRFSSSRSDVHDIVINEIMADPAFDFNGDAVSDTDDEYIELYNPSDSQISLAGCILDDIESGGSSQYVIPPTLMAPLSHLLFFRNETNIALNNNGEERVRLLDTGGGDIDNFTFHETEKNRSWARRGDGNPYWTMPREGSPGGANPTIPLIVINEFLTKPEGESTDEWIEFFNADCRTINMTDWTVGDMDGNEFAFPELLLAPGDYVVLNIGDEEGSTSSGQKVGLQYYMDNPNQVLTDSGDDIVLCDDTGLAVDYVGYGNGTSIDGCPVELLYSDPPVAPDRGFSLALLPNGNITDSGEYIELMDEINITKNWNNSMPISLAVSENFGFQLHGKTGSVGIPLYNPCGTASDWEIEVNASENLPDVVATDHLTIGPGFEVILSIFVEFSDSVVPGTRGEISLNISSVLVDEIQYIVNVYAVEASDVVINEIMIDPSGSDSEADEWLELLNRDDTEVNITGWSLFSKTSDISDIFSEPPLFVFPDLHLDPGEVLLMHTVSDMDEGFYSPGVEHLHINETNIWTNTRGSAALITSAYTGADFTRWGDTDDEPVFPDRFSGNCPVPRSGESLARAWYRSDSDNASDFFIPDKERITPGLDNGEFHTFAVQELAPVNVVEPGIVMSYEMAMFNTGNRTTTFQVNSSWTYLDCSGNGSPSDEWSVECTNTTLMVAPGGSENIALMITPPRNVLSFGRSGVNVYFTIEPIEDPWRVRSYSFSFQMPVVDLCLSDNHLEGEWENIVDIPQGKIVNLRVKLTNLGPVNSTAVNITLYVNSRNEENVVGRRQYQSVSGKLYSSTKNPSFKIDTLLYPGNHTFILTADLEDGGLELDRENNMVNLTLNITPAVITEPEKKLLITEFYYYSYIEDQLDEYVRIYNSGNETVDISGWQLADDASSDVNKGINFPTGTYLRSDSDLIVTRSAAELERSAGLTADLDAVPGGETMDMEAEDSAWIGLNDNSGQVVLRTSERIVVDNVLYGKEELDRYGWSGAGVLRQGKGYVTRRNIVSGRYMDTNTSSDFNMLKRYSLGGSDFEPLEIRPGDVEEMYFLPQQFSFHARPLLENASKEILLQSERFESALLFQCLMDALKRDVKLFMLLEGKPFGGIDDRQRYYTEELNRTGASIHYMDEDSKEGRYNRYQNLHGNYIVADGERALMQTAAFHAEGAPGDGVTGLKGMGFVSGSEVAARIREYFFDDLNLSKRDITPYDTNHSSFGGLDDDYIFKPDEMYGTVYCDVPTELNEPDIVGEIGFYPDTSCDLNEGADDEKDIMGQALEAADRYVYILTDNIEPFADISTDEGIILPHVDSILDAAARGVEIRIILDISESNMLFKELEDRANITGIRNSAMWLREEAIRRKVTDLEVRFDYLDGATGIGGTIMLVDNISLVISSAGIEFDDIYLNREWAARFTDNDWPEIYSLYQRWWARSIPLEGTLEEEYVAYGRDLLITEVYYNSLRSYKPDQFVKIYNPGNSPVDMSWWRLSDKQSSSNSLEGTVIFPKGVVLAPGETLVVARKAEDYHSLTGEFPNLEYDGDTDPSIPGMLQVKDPPVLVPLRDEMFLVRSDGHLVDAVVYGQSGHFEHGWNGEPSPVVDSGALLMRRRDIASDRYNDTNTSADFTHLRPFRPGQSSFKNLRFEVNGNITAFVSPDNSFDVMMGALSAAKRTLFINIYQFHNPYLLDRVVNLSKDGVDVKVLLEGGPVGGVTDYQKYVSMMLNGSGAQVRYMISDRAEGLGSRYDYDHAKYVVIDNRTLILLSENFVTTGIPINYSYGNRGWGVVVEDESLARYFSDVFFHDFNPLMMDSFPYTDNHTSYGEPPEDLDMSYYVRKGSYMSRFEPLGLKGSSIITPILSPDTSSSTEDSIISMMDDAEKYIKIEQLDCDIDWTRVDKEYNWSDYDNYYLNFSDGGEHYNLYLKAAIDAARRGVKVRVLLDSAFVWDWAKREDNSDTVHYIKRIADIEGLDMEANLVALGGVSGRAGLEKVHNKGVIVDGEKVLVSSINWGASSVLKNREAGLIIENSEVAGYYEGVFDFDWNLSVFNFVSPYVIYSGNRTLVPAGSTQIRVALTYLNSTIPVTLRFNVSHTGPMDVELSHTEMRIYPGETRELDIMFQADEEAVPGSDCHVLVRLGILDFDQDFLFFDVNITDKVEEKAVPGKDSWMDTFENIFTVILVAFVILIVAAGRDIIMNWQNNKNKRKGKVGTGDGDQVDVVEASDEIVNEVAGEDSVDSDMTVPLDTGDEALSSEEPLNDEEVEGGSENGEAAVGTDEERGVEMSSGPSQ